MMPMGRLGVVPTFLLGRSGVPRANQAGQTEPRSVDDCEPRPFAAHWDQIEDGMATSNPAASRLRRLDWKGLHLKIGAVLGVVLTSAVALVALAGAIATSTLGNQIVDEAVHDKMRVAQALFASAISAETQRALTLAHALALNTDIQSRFAAQDRDGLAKMLVPGFSDQRSQDGVVQLQFHLPPAISFLRVHRPEKFGDDLSSFRRTVVETNKTHKPVFGLENGVEGLGIRGVEPVDFEGKHIGSVEVGLSLGNEFFARFKKETGNDVSFYLEKDGKPTLFGTSFGK